jgi:hypothetical protein
LQQRGESNVSGGAPVLYCSRGVFDVNLRRATLLAIIGSCYTFLSRAIGTFRPDILTDLTMARGASILSVLAALASVVFYISFYTRYPRLDQIELRNSSILAIVGSALFVALQVKGLLILFNAYSIPSLLRFHTFEAVLPLVASLLILLFFVTFYGETYRTKEESLKRPVLFAIIGTAVSASVRILVLVNYLFSRTNQWFSGLPRHMQFALYPVLMFGFFMVLYFLISFYRTLEKTREA